MKQIITKQKPEKQTHVIDDIFSDNESFIDEEEYNVNGRRYSSNNFQKIRKKRRLGE